VDEQEWTTLLRRIKEGKCTPFLGAGVNEGVLPLGSAIARIWAQENAFPMKDANDLARVAQFLAIRRPDPMDPKEELLSRWFKNIPRRPEQATPDPLDVLADLPLPIYLTTNYDDLMAKALKRRGREPHRELCRWNNHPRVRKRQSVWDRTPGFRPSWNEPVVFHLHGLDEVYESLVLTEDDYLDFLVSISRDDNLLPPYVQEALTGSSLLFVGYKLADYTFRVLFRGLVNSMEPGLRRISVSVQVGPSGSGEEHQREREYLDKYFENIKVKVYWGTASDFAAELSRRWELVGYGS
jgi:hypothetical protein